MPNWTEQAKPKWVKLLQRLGALEPGDKKKAQFTDLGLELVFLFEDVKEEGEPDS